MDSAERQRLSTDYQIAAEAEAHYRNLQSPVPIIGTYGLAAMIAMIAGFLFASWIVAGAVVVVSAMLLEGLGFGFSMYKETKQRADDAARRKEELRAQLNR